MPFSSRFRQNKTDTGILGCTDPNSICVKDTLSSLGGGVAFLKMRVVVNYRMRKTIVLKNVLVMVLVRVCHKTLSIITLVKTVAAEKARVEDSTVSFIHGKF